MKKLLIGVAVGVFMLVVSVCWAGIPFLMNYQGMLTDDGGNPLDGDYNLTFKIYSQSSGGSALWTEAHTGIQVQGGLFNVTLGSLTTLPSSVFGDTIRYLGITVGTDPELSPRIRITSMAYAYRALVADSAAIAGSVTGSAGGWVDDGSVVRLETSTDQVGIGTSSPQAGLHLKGTGFPSSFMFLQSNTGQDAGIRFYEGEDVKWHIFNSSADGGLRIYNANATRTVFFADQSTGNVGIGTTTPNDDLHVANHIRIGEDPTYSTVYGELKHDGSGTGFIINSHAGGGTWADLHFQTNGTTKMFIESSGKVGIGTTSPSYKLHVIESDPYYAVYAENTSYDSYGILGWNVGVYGKQNSSGNYGYIGAANSGVYGHSISDRGVSGSSSSGYGVRGQSTTGTGVYFSGGLAGSGTKSCIVKTSKGPTYLYCQESPENWFEDFGEGQLIAGRCYIELDPLFLETVTINELNPMKVFIQLNEDCNGTYVERSSTGFDVIELQGGQSSARFTYRVVAKRSGFEDKRLNVCEAAKADPYLYPEANEMMDK